MTKQFNFTIFAACCFSLVCTVAAIVLQQAVLLLIPFVVIISVLALYYTKLVWYIMLISLPLSTETSITATLSLDLPDEGILILCSLIFVLQWILKSIQIPQKVVGHKLCIVLAISFIWYVVAGVFSTSVLLSSKFIIAKLWYVIPFVLMPLVYIRTKKDIITIAQCLLAGMAFTVIIILYKHSNSKFIFDHINNAVAPFYRNHVNYAAMLVCLFPVGVAFYFAEKKVVTKRIYLLFIILFLFGLVVSYSRGAWLAMGTGAISIILLKKKWLSASFILFIISCIGIALWSANNNKYIQYHPNYKKTIYHANFNDHINATFKGTDLSNAERFNRWIAGVRMVNEGKPTGFGPNTFYTNYKPYIVTYFKTWVSDNPEKSTVHNYFLLTLIEQGWVGFILLLALIYIFYRQAEKLYCSAKNSFIKNTTLVISVIFSMILTLNFLSDLVETDKIGSLYYLCIGIISALHKLNIKPTT